MIHVGQKLQEERVRKRLTLEEVSRAIKIRLSFLIAIEKGEYEKLPSSAYAQGFVKNYAEFLGLSTKTILAMFRREFDEEKMYRILPEGLTSSDDFALKSIRLSQGIILMGGILLAIVCYVLFQYRYAFINPPLNIKTPKENQVFSSQEILVSGTTDPNATVVINNQVVGIDANGDFTKVIDVFLGKESIAIKAKNKFGRETIIERQIEVTKE